MKSYTNLFEKVIDFENLWRAYRRARKGKRSRPLEPIFEPRFIADSYACRVGKGTHRAILRCQQFQRRFAYRMQCDIVRFFPTVDHEILASLIARRVRDARVMELVRGILASGTGIPDESPLPPHWFPGDDLFAPLRPRSLPIGNLTSQFWANVYLDPLDHFVKEGLRCRGYVRYCDDFILFGDSPAQLREWRGRVVEYLAGLRLRLHTGRCHIVQSRQGIPFLGFRIFPDRRLLLRQGVRRFRRRLVGLQQGFAAGAVTATRIGHSIASWVAHAAWGNTAGLRRAILGNVTFSRG